MQPLLFLIAYFPPFSFFLASLHLVGELKRRVCFTVLSTISAETRHYTFTNFFWHAGCGMQLPPPPQTSVLFCWQNPPKPLGVTSLCQPQSHPPGALAPPGPSLRPPTTRRPDVQPLILLRGSPNTAPLSERELDTILPAGTPPDQPWSPPSNDSPKIQGSKLPPSSTLLHPETGVWARV